MIEKIFQYINSRTDKALHFGGGYILATAFPIPALYGLVIALLAGILKEVYDGRNTGHTIDKYDTLATLVGGLIGFIALVIK